jgi:hypothetical protein
MKYYLIVILFALLLCWENSNADIALPTMDECEMSAIYKIIDWKCICLVDWCNDSINNKMWNGVYTNHNNKVNKKRWINPLHFKELSMNYFIDDKNAYYLKDWSLKKISNVDVNTFQQYFKGYFYDRNYIYFNGKKIKWLNPAEIKVSVQNRSQIWQPFYIQDNKNVYYNWNIIKNVHLNSFEDLWNHYAKDKNNIYYYWSIIPNATNISLSNSIEKWFWMKKNTIKNTIIYTLSWENYQGFNEQEFQKMSLNQSNVQKNISIWWRDYIKHLILWLFK